MSKYFIVLVFLLLSILRCYSGLQWETIYIKRIVESNEKNINSILRFKNIGNHPIEIEKVEASCGCNKLDYSKKIYKPQESGEINVYYDVHAKTKSNKKYIYIITICNGVKERFEISLEYISKIEIEVSTNSLSWVRESNLYSKDVFVTIGSDIKITDIKTLNDSFLISLNKVDEVNFELSIIPKDTSKILDTSIVIEFEKSDGAKSQFAINAGIYEKEIDKYGVGIFETISISDLNSLLENDNKILLIDARPNEYYKQGHIEKAISLPLNEIKFIQKEYILNLIRNFKKVVVYCADSSCDDSTKLAHFLFKLDKYLEIKIYSNGWAEWKDRNK